TGIAVVNPTSTPESVSVAVQTAAGVISGLALPAIPAQGHMSFFLPQQFPGTSGQRGLMEFTTSGSLSMIALRFNPTGAFTAAPVYAQTGSSIIGTSGGTLPDFISIQITAIFSPASQPSYPITITIVSSAPGTYFSAIVSCGGMSPCFSARPVASFVALFN